MKRLWLALVENERVPGTIPVLLFQEKEPSDPLVKRRIGYSPKGELQVTGMFDLTHVLMHDAESLLAVQGAIAALDVGYVR